MAKTKLQKAYDQINASIRQEVPKAVHKRFGLEVVTGWSFAANAVVTSRVDGERLTDEQVAYIRAFEDGYSAALEIVERLSRQ